MLHREPTLHLHYLLRLSLDIGFIPYLRYCTKCWKEPKCTFIQKCLRMNVLCLGLETPVQLHMTVAWSFLFWSGFTAHGKWMWMDRKELFCPAGKGWMKKVGALLFLDHDWTFKSSGLCSQQDVTKNDWVLQSLRRGHLFGFYLRSFSLCGLNYFFCELPWASSVNPGEAFKVLLRLQGQRLQLHSRLFILVNLDIITVICWGLLSARDI